MVIYNTLEDLLLHLNEMDRNYGQAYGAALFANGFSNSDQLGNAVLNDLVQAGIANRLHASDIKTKCSGLLVAQILASHPQWLNVASATASVASSVRIREAQDPELVQWEYCDADVMETLAVLDSRCTGPDPRPNASNNLSRPYLSEADCNRQFAVGVLNVCEKVLESTGRSYTFHDQLREVSNCVPDFAWLDIPPGDLTMQRLRGPGRSDFLVGCSFMYVEGKVTSVLNFHGNNIITAFRERHSGAIEVLNQIFFYMTNNRHKYGFITDYLRTWACRQDGDGKLHVTKAYLCKSRPTAQHPQGQAPQGQGISVAQLMMSLILRSRSEDRPGPVQDSSPTSSPMKRVCVGVSGAASGGAAGSNPARGGATGGSATRGSPASSSASYRQFPSTCLTLMESLGEGISGTVRKARLGDRLVALKAADAVNARESVRMLKHEAAVYDALCSLQSVAIPELVGCGYASNGNVFILATSLVLGSHPILGQRFAHSVRAGAIRALGMIHAAGYLHKDIRHQNMIVEQSSGQVFFIDFGFSCSKEQCKGEFEVECEAEMEELLSMLADSEESQQIMEQCMEQV